MFAMFSPSLAIRFLMFLNHNVSKAKKNNIFFVIYMTIDGSKSRFFVARTRKNGVSLLYIQVGECALFDVESLSSLCLRNHGSLRGDLLVV